MFFIALGVIGGTWLIPWAFWAPRSTTRLTKVMPASASPSYLEIMRVRAIWGTSIGHFGGNYFMYFLVTWLPSYLVEERGFSLQKTGFLGALPFVVIAISTISAGWLSDRMIQRGGSVSKVRLGFAATGLAGSVGRHSGAAPANRVDGHGGTLHRGPLLRSVLFQLVGDHADPRRSHRRRQVVGPSELLSATWLEWWRHG